MERTGYQWGLSLLWVNLAVAVTVLILIVGHQAWRAPELAHIIGYSLVYANLCGVLGVLLVRAVARKPVSRLLPLAAVVAGAIIVSAVIGCLLAQTLLLEANLVAADGFWSEYWRVLRTAIPLGLVFGSGALAHASLRARAHAPSNFLFGMLLGWLLTQRRAAAPVSAAHLRLPNVGRAAAARNSK